MPTGTVKYVDAKGQYGFISRDDKQCSATITVSGRRQF